jgi:hypothetical protein
VLFTFSIGPFTPESLERKRTPFVEQRSFQFRTMFDMKTFRQKKEVGGTLEAAPGLLRHYGTLINRRLPDAHTYGRTA